MAYNTLAQRTINIETHRHAGETRQTRVTLTSVSLLNSEGIEPVSLLLYRFLFDNTEREEYAMTKDTHAQTRATPGAGNKKPENDMRNNNMSALVDATST
jgi:hypothetical protein